MPDFLSVSLSSTDYVGRTINDDSSTFGFNFIDGRIKSYPNGVLSGPTGCMVRLGVFTFSGGGNPTYLTTDQNFHIQVIGRP